jgi:hypothetical protein
MRFADLLEGPEDPVHVIGFDAYASVGDTKFDPMLVGNVLDPDVDAAVRRELECITDKILQNFLQLCFVGNDVG